MKLEPHIPTGVPARGRFTLPTEAGRDDLVRELAARWGADTIRDSDGTELSPELLELGFEVFSTVLLTRADQAFARAHPEFLIRKFFRSDPMLAESATVEIRPLDGFDPRKYRTDVRNEPKAHWQVFDRATGLEHPPQLWDYDAARDTVTIRGAIPWHPYTVNFLVEQIWDSTSMHNHLTNNWTCDPKMGIDIHINACEGGVVLRRCAEAPGRQTKELRFYPYLFPDTFNHAGGQPLRDSQLFWANVRRALVRTPVDRIGYGGYLSLAAEFPGFVEHVAHLANEFRTILATTRGTRSARIPAKVGILNAWGARRSWIPFEGRDQKFPVPYSDNMFLLARSYLLECLAGLPVDVAFLSFEDIAGGVPTDIGVLINDGDAGTAHSGGRHWADPAVLTAVRQFVHQGGGFIGVREPSAHPAGGRNFQLADVLGVDLETGDTANLRPVAAWAADPDHFILDPALKPSFGTDRSYVAPVTADVQVLATGPGGHVLAAARDCGRGRAVYLAGLPALPDNCALLLRAIAWAAHAEDSLTRWHCSNPHTECAWFPRVSKLIVLNNSPEAQTTTVLDGAGEPHEITLAGYESRWFNWFPAPPKAEHLKDIPLPT